MESELALERFSIRRIGALYSNQSYSPNVHLVIQGRLAQRHPLGPVFANGHVSGFIVAHSTHISGYPTNQALMGPKG